MVHRTIGIILKEYGMEPAPKRKRLTADPNGA